MSVEVVVLGDRKSAENASDHAYHAFEFAKGFENGRVLTGWDITGRFT